uniref:hypothetical protein n=1 Tax=Halomonas sp. TaxID=1486246 RepID=UPI00262B8D5F|nr:hypothetical protein [Halomonas sp.]
MMHDWTLLSINFEWEKGVTLINLRNPKSQEVSVVARGTKKLIIPRQEGWGPSVSINDTEGPFPLENGNLYFSLEIQSGDNIELEAKGISLPHS